MVKQDQPFKRLSFEANEIIFDEGDIGRTAYLITGGRVELKKNVHGDNPQTLAVVRKGATIGEMALFDERPRMAQAVTLTITEVIEISYDEFQRRLGDMDPIMKGLVTLMITRIRQMTDEFIRRKTRP